MKPTQCNRRACEFVRDFLVGLAVFFTFFMLAMLDSRTSHSATADKYMAAPPGIHETMDNSAMPAVSISKLAMKKTNHRPSVLPLAVAPSGMNRSWMLAVTALFFAAMTAITLGLWRHLRRSVSPKRKRQI